MKNQRGSSKVASIILTTILIIILVICFKIYKRNFFNGFEKAKRSSGETIFIRDSDIRYSEYSSYKVENIEYNDSAFYKEVEVEPNTPYKISCMIKTENVVCEDVSNEGGAVIGLLDTTEYSRPVIGTNDWQYVEFMFNSKNRDKVKISFRLGGNENNCTGAAWFSDLKLEKGLADNDGEWNAGCFIIKELDVNIEGKEYHLKTNLDDIQNVKSNMERVKNDLYQYSNRNMTMNYDIIEITEPVTTISYEDEHGYYISSKDITEYVYDTAIEKQYDHIFVVCRMEDEEGNVSIPIHDNWIGLGGMDVHGIGYSLIRINKNSNTHTYKYGIRNHFPEEVYLHEFLHTLERNTTEYGYEIPALHDYGKYGYTETSIDGLDDWYKDYMKKTILDKSTGTYVGLDSFVYQTQPPNRNNFTYPIEIEIEEEPQNIVEEINTMIDVLKGA